MEFQAALIAANDYLQKCYINSRYSPTADEWPPYQPRHYTTLALIHHKDKCTDATVISVSQKLAVAGRFQTKVKGLSESDGSIPQMPNIYLNTTKNISDIFTSVIANDGVTINPCIILIEGAPGIGKTVLAKEIAFQWANNKLLSSKKILLLLLLRECNFERMISAKNLLEHVVESNKITTSLTEYLLQTEGKDLVIVLDGYDEISEKDRSKSIIARIIYHRLFAKCCLVITSRPTASSNLHGILDCRVEVVGFTEEDRMDYIQTALQGTNDKVEALTSYLQSNPTINALCYIPLNMTILLCLAENGIDRLPKTQTDMYKKFIEMTTLHFIQKLDIQGFEIITSIAKLPHPHNRVFEELARLAYEALKIDKIVFKLNEIKEVCPNLATFSINWSGLGLLKAERYFNAEIGNVTFHFLHFSIQEYMAAWYISTLSQKKQIKLLGETFWKHRYYNTWIMYVGITCGDSFALKHFLSGNWFQLSTRLFKASNISKKILGNKIKCLHLFQCLVESNNESMIASVSKFFQDDQIDLSNQTLLPSDVNTLGFFLIRSINKQWEMLNISGCNIGSIGINILCDRFLNKESREIVVIRTLDFSYNQLNFSSLIQSFELFKSWQTSQLFIKESSILQTCTINDVYKAIEDAFFPFNYDYQLSLTLGSFLFVNKFSMLPLQTTVYKSLYLLNCKLTTELSNFKNLIEVHLINTYSPIQSLKKLWFSLLDTANANVFIYNPELSDHDADEMCNFISSSEIITVGIKLIISSCKIQGTINTCAINEQLTKLEIFNIAVNVNQNHIQNYPWKRNLCYDSINNYLIVYTFYELLHKIILNKPNWQLKIVLRQKDVLIAHRSSYKSISKKIQIDQPLKAIYLNEYNIKGISWEYEILLDTKRTLRYLYICNSWIDQEWFASLRTALFECKEMFIHTLCDSNVKEILSCFQAKRKHSTVLVSRNEIIGCNPTTKQVALAFQLEPSIGIFKLFYCHGNFDCFNQIVTMLVSTQIIWAELDFMHCTLNEVEYKIIQKHLSVNENHSTVSMLNVSTMQLTESLVPEFIKTILMWKVQQVIFHGIDLTVYERFIATFTTTITTNSSVLYLSVTYNSKKEIYFCNYSWYQITRLLESNAGAIMYLYNCHFPLQAENINITAFHMSKLHIINSTLHESTIVNILENSIERILEISICNTSIYIDDKALYNSITRKKLFYRSEINFVVVLKNFTFGYNITEDQLHLLKSQQLNSLEQTIITLVSDTKTMHEKELFVFQNKHLTALHLNVKTSQPKFVAKLVTALKETSSLKYFGIDKYTITSDVADNIASILTHNKELEYLYLNSEMDTKDLLNIMEVLLEKFTNLKVLEISYSKITDQVSEYLTSLVSRNVQLQHFNIFNSNWCTANTVKISKTLQNTSNLLELTINGSNIDAEAGNFIASVVSGNGELQKLDLSDNNLQTKGIKIIAKSLQNISTLTTLHVSNNNITKEASDDIAAAFSCNTQLQEIDISRNIFETSGVIVIAKSLQNILVLRKFCISSNSINEAAAGNIAAAINSNVQLQEFDVSNNNLQSTGAIKIAKALQTISTLKKFCISNNNITDEAADDIGIAISHNTQLQVLDISKNLFQTSGIITIAKALQSVMTLNKFYISDNNVTDEAANDVALVLHHNTHLQELDIGLTQNGVMCIMKALHSIIALRVLKMKGNELITDEAAESIAAAVSSSTELQMFDISKTFFSPKGIQKISKALQCFSTLTKLYISNNSFTDEVTQYIAAVINSNTELREFDVSKNNLQSIGIIEIAKALQNISTLTKLYINDNHNITDTAADDIATVLHRNTQLQELDVSKNHFEVTGIMRIAKALQGKNTLKKLYIKKNNITDIAAGDVAAIVFCCTQLEVLDISGNFIETPGILKIAKALQQISTLQQLYIDNNEITDAASDDIAAICSYNTRLQILHFHNNLFTLGIAGKLYRQCKTLLHINASICHS